tara:strand:- start:485 stop:793 length:309 start_codon:yes stop_codon:yes gene_type:complete
MANQSNVARLEEAQKEASQIQDKIRRQQILIEQTENRQQELYQRAREILGNNNIQEEEILPALRAKLTQINDNNTKAVNDFQNAINKIKSTIDEIEASQQSQ